MKWFLFSLMMTLILPAFGAVSRKPQKPLCHRNAICRADCEANKLRRNCEAKCARTPNEKIDCERLILVKHVRQDLAAIAPTLAATSLNGTAKPGCFSNYTRCMSEVTLENYSIKYSECRAESRECKTAMRTTAEK